MGRSLEVLKGFLEATVRDAVTYTEHSRRKTVRADAKNHERIQKMQSAQEKAPARAHTHTRSRTHARTHTHTHTHTQRQLRFYGIGMAPGGRWGLGVPTGASSAGPLPSGAGR